MISLGGGAMVSKTTARKLRERALTVLVEVDVDEAWKRARRSRRRPLAERESEFRQLFEQRLPLYEDAADARARDADDIVLAAAGILVEEGAYGLARACPEACEVAIDERVRGLHPPPLDAPDARGRREDARRLRASLARAAPRARRDAGRDRRGHDHRRRGLRRGHVHARHSLDSRADDTRRPGRRGRSAARRASTSREGKNLVGAFHWPERTVVDHELLATLPAAERRNGLAEVVKTGLLAGEELWELPEPELVRRCAAFKAAVCLRDPRDEGERAMLNLGHTFAHALEAASEYTLPHGEAVALGLTAALRLSDLAGRCRPRRRSCSSRSPPASTADTAWAALQRDKKSRGGSVQLVLLDAPGKPRTGVELPEKDVRRALADLIA